MALRFDGKVVVVTGAGGGLGRTYALLFGSRGAKVVVNDLGGECVRAVGRVRPRGMQYCVHRAAHACLAATCCLLCTGRTVPPMIFAGGTSGEGASRRPAELVCEEIRRLGGVAVPDFHSVEDGDKIIETAVKAFGTVHILINNAGILRDVSFQKMKDSDWCVLGVHAAGKGATVTCAACCQPRHAP
jgi:NAD(P)-dependent dehydrogenase (short-subunit alcohol dehydrogenase family)